MNFTNNNIENCIKIAIAGNVDSGKSTLIGVLSNNILDDGRGLARSKILKNKHEKETGRTSSITYSHIEYNLDKKKILTLIDLAGHEKYLKTTMMGLTGLYPDYGIVVVGANMGINKMTKEHLGIMLYLKLPIIVVITKIDICPDNIYEKTKNNLRKILKVPIFNKRPFFISKEEDKSVLDLKKYLKLNNVNLIPVLSISNKTGKNLKILNEILYNLKPRELWIKNNIEGSKLYIDSIFQVKGIGIVVSGTLKGKPIEINQKLWIGPINNKFYPIRARSIHNNIRQSVDKIYDKEIGCIALKLIGKDIFTRKQIKKGTLIFSNEKFKNNVKRDFDAKITVLNHTTTITDNYEPVIHCGLIRQTARIKINNILNKKKKILRTGSNAIVSFRFSYHSEFIEKGDVFFFRDGNTKGYGEIIKVK
jgi:elongation factor 1-alpha